MNIPVTFVLFRVTAAVLTLLVVVAFVLGLSGHGPLDGIHAWTTATENWLHINTGVKFG
jgi:hypothetical protein